MKVVITGGSGLIGRALCKKLAAEGHEVTILSRTPNKATGLPRGVQVARWDARSSHGWEHLADGADAIINLAGANLADGRWTPARKYEIMESRLNAGRAVVEAVRKAKRKPRVVIQASAVGYYGSNTQAEVTEQSGAGDDFPARVCVEWEASTEPVEAMGVRRIVVRTGVVMSTKGGALPRMALPFKLFAGGPVGTGKQPFPWIHIEDEVRAIIWLLENGGAGAYNLTGSNPLTNKEFSRSLGRAMGRPSAVPVPSFALKALFGEMSTILLEGQCATPHRLLTEGFEFRNGEAEPALRDLFKNGN